MIIFRNLPSGIVNARIQQQQVQTLHILLNPSRKPIHATEASEIQLENINARFWIQSLDLFTSKQVIRCDSTFANISNA